jgi:hypothetical protein
MFILLGLVILIKTLRSGAYKSFGPKGPLIADFLASACFFAFLFTNVYFQEKVWINHLISELGERHATAVDGAAWASNLKVEVLAHANSFLLEAIAFVLSGIVFGDALNKLWHGWKALKLSAPKFEPAAS